MKKIYSILVAIALLSTPVIAQTTVKDGKCFDEKKAWAQLANTKKDHPKYLEAKVLADLGISKQKGSDCEILVQQAIDLIKN